jgi:hypothetical protein
VALRGPPGLPPSEVPVRPLLTTAVRRVWRDGETLQLGLPPGRSALLVGLDPPARAALTLLDGTRDGGRLQDAAAAAGCPPQRTTALLSLLDGAGLLQDAAAGRGALAGLDRADRDRLGADLASLALVRGDDGLPALHCRLQAKVLVLGGGRVGAPLAAMLAAAGVGGVDVADGEAARPEDVGVGGLLPRDVGRSRGEAARDGVRALAPSTTVGPQPRPDVVVLAPTAPDALDEAALLLPDSLPHLVAQVRGEVGVVGPLVLPGRSACLSCLDHTRTDLDPGWPTVATQLAAPGSGPVPCDGPLAVMVAAQAALQTLALLDGSTTPAAVDGTLELTLPDWRWRRRSWVRHPSCDCRWHVA